VKKEGKEREGDEGEKEKGTLASISPPSFD